jgi:hypothetical protein
MSNREKGILVFMAIAVLYGIYSFFLASSPKPVAVNRGKSIDDITQFIGEVTDSLKEDSSEKNTYVLAQAKAQWTQDPFLPARALTAKSDIVVETLPGASSEEVSYRYSGYIKMGNRKLAIINGLEYELGNELKQGGKVVKEIGPMQIVIGNPNEDNNLTLLLDETK